MFLFGVTALEEFVDKLHQWPQYLSNLITIPALKNCPHLFEKVNEKYNEINNKNKNKDNQSDGKNQFQFNNVVNNLNNFDFQNEEKRSNKDLTHVSKMPIFANEEFNRNFKNMSVNEKHIPGGNQFMIQNQDFVQSHNYFQQQGNKSKKKSNRKFIFFLNQLKI